MELLACPFCRQLFPRGEARVCPDCDVELRPLAELPPSHDAAELEPGKPSVAPEDEPLPAGYLGRNRGAIALCALCGLGLYFAPWMDQAAPEIRLWSGVDFARRLAWPWAGFVAWVVLLPLVLSRRTIRQMRGARVATAALAAIALANPLALRMAIAFQPKPHPLLTVRYVWSWGFYGAAFVAVLALIMALRFGGSVTDMTTARARAGGETLH